MAAAPMKDQALAFLMNPDDSASRAKALPLSLDRGDASFVSTRAVKFGAQDV